MQCIVTLDYCALYQYSYLLTYIRILGFQKHTSKFNYSAYLFTIHFYTALFKLPEIIENGIELKLLIQKQTSRLVVHRVQSNGTNLFTMMRRGE